MSHCSMEAQDLGPPAQVTCAVQFRLKLERCMR